MTKKEEGKKAISKKQPAKVISLDEYRKERVERQEPGKISNGVKKMGTAGHTTSQSSSFSASQSRVSYQVGSEQGNVDDILEKFRMAEYLITIAMSVGDNEEKIGIAEEALKTFPDFTSAYNILAEFKAKDSNARLAYYQKGIEAWERFHEFLEYESSVRNSEPDLTPYFTAMMGAADSLWSLKRFEESLVTYWTLLKLEKHDLFGIRFIIIARLLEFDKNEEFYELISTIPTEKSSVISWGKVLYYFRLGEKENAVKELATAMKESPRVADYLTGLTTLPFEMPRYSELNKKSEQVWAASLLSESWKSTAGAMYWLKKSVPKN